MIINRPFKALLASVCVALSLLGGAAHAQPSHYQQLAELPFPGAYPTKESAKTLQQELAFQRAVQTYLWSLPAMNLYSMREGQKKTFGADSNVLAIWKDRIDFNTRVSTANPDVIYAFAWLDLDKQGPMVLDMPPRLQGLLDDMWHRPLTDIGNAGPDKGRGGKYLVLPPGYTGEVPAGYHSVESPTNGVFVFLRAFLVDGKTDQGVALLKKSKIYPLSQADNPPAMQFPNASGVAMNGDFPRGLEYFERLAALINDETVSREDFAMRGMLAGIGIVKGQPFNPDASMKALLDSAGQVGFKMAAVVDYDYFPRNKVYSDRMWEQVFIGGSPVFEADTYLNLDALIAFFHKAYSTSNAMVIAMPGKGAQYLVGMRDVDSNYLMGENSYRLHVPANVPAANYWSAVLYDADTRVLLDNGEPFPSIASNTNLTLNDDGSSELYFGPTAPADKQANWIKTVPGRGYFLGVRFYSPTQAFFDQSWRPDDIVKISTSH
ncbi:MAG: DUF1254 domain-containing protein [Motiliproteus sp.]